MAAQKIPLLQPDEYLTWEASQKEKHEYISGEILAMAGASYTHNLVVAEVIRLLGNALADRDCITLPSDQKVRIREAGPFFYPDVSVACEPFLDDDSCLRNPMVIIEVLSESTDHMIGGRNGATIASFPRYVTMFCSLRPSRSPSTIAALRESKPSGSLSNYAARKPFLTCPLSPLKFP